ncbi:hypothetical protein PIB30_076797 [Stylosanthes scabra]|uniref:Uncharacterized protein n=1 Tax=Stylosanthes scabra TaxID=79078 RepID=A0ABU6RQX7_9FABA|nr:hypothetical protein [Stylosanthes scabra]
MCRFRSVHRFHKQRGNGSSNEAHIHPICCNEGRNQPLLGNIVSDVAELGAHQAAPSIRKPSPSVGNEVPRAISRDASVDIVQEDEQLGGEKAERKPYIQMR